MKIWIDTIQAPHLIEGDDSVQLEQFRTTPLQQTRALYKKRCNDERWLVCEPLESGHIAVVDTEAFNLLEHFNTLRTPEDAALLEQRYISSPYTNLLFLFYELGFLQSRDQSRTALRITSPQTLSAWLHVTNACNLRCHYCYIYKSKEQLTDDISRRAVDAIIRSATRHNFQRIKLKYAGGEASLNFPRILSIHDYASHEAKSRGLDLSAYMMSNGVSLSQRVIEQLLVRRIDVMISLDGIGDYHDRQRPFLNGKGSFKYVDHTITQLLANGLVPSINVTVSAQNLDGLTNLVEYILEREMPFTLSYYRENEYSAHLHDLQFSETNMITKMLEVFSYIEHHLPKRCLISSLIDKANLTSPHHHTCGVGRNYLVIDQNGQIAKCHANITQTITTIDADDPLQVIRDDTRGIQGLPVEEKEGCRTCQWRHWCAGGCPLITYRVTGRNDIKSPNCNIYKALFPEALHLEALRLLKYAPPFVIE
jgi:uncharacterized protein